MNVAQGFIELIKNSNETNYYAYCDQDDVWHKNKLYAAVTKLEKEDASKALMYYSATTLVDENLSIIKEHQIHKKRSDLARFIFNDMSGNTIVINKVLRSFLCQSPNENIVIHDKWTLQLCLSIGGKCIGDDKSYNFYRQHRNNTIGMELMNNPVWRSHLIR